MYNHNDRKREPVVADFKQKEFLRRTTLKNEIITELGENLKKIGKLTHRPNFQWTYKARSLGIILARFEKMKELLVKFFKYF